MSAGNTMSLASLLPVYPPQPATFVDGEGMWLTDADGRRYLDFGAGIAVVSLGHRHPAPLAAAHAQLDRLWHSSNLFATEPDAALAAALSERFASAAEGCAVYRPGDGDSAAVASSQSAAEGCAVYRPGDGGSAAVASSQGAHAFFCNSGTEANEAAIKYARKATGKAGVLALEGSFHGRTLGALAATGQPAKRAAFEPLGPASFAVPNDIASLHAAASDEIGLVLIEPVLGEGGVIPLEPSFVQAAADVADGLGAVLAFDEVQTGIGRTGTFFAFEQLGVRPHLVTLAKALANGLPIGCLLVADDAPAGLAQGDHGSTFGGNPVACAAATAVLATIDDALLANVVARGAELAAGLAALPGVAEVRGRGLLLGAVLDRPAKDVAAAALDAGLVCLTAGPNVLRLAPPLVVGAEEIRLALDTLTEVLA